MQDSRFNADWWTEESSLRFEKLSDEEALDNVIETVLTRFEKIDEEIIKKAWDLAVNVHSEQTSTYSKRRVLRHVLAVAKTVAEIGLDPEAVVAAIFHDILEETNITYFQLERDFGKRILRIVLAVSRYDNKQVIKSEAGHQRDILKKLFDVLSDNLEDLPAVFIKLAEKYDHLRFSIPYLPYDQQKDMANEIMVGYAPLAERLGVYRLKAQLEDLAFRTTNYEDYIAISRKLQVQRENTDAFFRKAIPELKARIAEAGIEAEVSARRKHIYSTYEKLRRKGKKLGVADFVGVRIIVNSISECYLVVRIIHEIWKPLPGEFDDYIGNPKANNYQSLHTTTISKEGFAIEVQIRTKKMHEIAEFGLAAHWRYKGSGDLKDESLNAQFSGLQRQFEASRRIDDIEEFYRNLSDDVLQEQIHIYFSGDGELVSLPKHATPIDLAYAVDEELAPQCISAKVGDFEIPLDWQLNNGDRVSLLTSPDHNEPEREWLTFVKTARAREAIKKIIQQYPREVNIPEGLPILQKELRIMGIVAPVSDVALLTHYNNPDDLLCDIGSGNLNARNVVEALFKKPYRDQIIQYWARETSRMENMSVPETILLGECCNPDLGVQLVAFVENSILTVHRIDCDEIMKKEKTKLLKLLGLDPYEIILTVYVRIKAKDRAGLLHDITNVLSEFSINILNIGNSKDPITNSVTIDLAIEIVYATRLIEVLHRLSLIAHAESVQRIEAPFEKMQWKVASQADISLKPESILYPVSAFEEITKQTSSETAIVNQQELRKVIDEGFSLDELVVLCADVEQRILEDRANTRNRGIAHLNLDMFGLNRPKANLITDLIQYLYRRDLLSYLLQVVNLERPGLLDKVIRYSSNKRQ